VASVAIYVDSIGNTFASGRVNFFNASPSIGSAGRVGVWLDADTYISSRSGDQNGLVTLIWNVSNLKPGKPYSIDAVGHTLATRDFFTALFQNDSRSASSVSFSTTTISDRVGEKCQV
jgi:hypothetical protein